jgi:hypothetical protein
MIESVRVESKRTRANRKKSSTYHYSRGYHLETWHVGYLGDNRGSLAADDSAGDLLRLRFPSPIPSAREQPVQPFLANAPN